MRACVRYNCYLYWFCVDACGCGIDCDNCRTLYRRIYLASGSVCVLSQGAVQGGGCRNKKYKNVHSVCEIGAGYGVLARYVARKCDVSVTALENVWFTYFIASICRILPGGNKVRNVCADAFEYLKGENVHFNIGIAYLCPEVNDCLMDFMDKFDVLILLDFPTSGVAPVRVVDVGHGFTRFNNKKYPHQEIST